MEKRATYINKVNELTKEFIGSALWDLFGIEALRLEKSWNVSQRIMLGIPRNSHRYFIEPLSFIRRWEMFVY